MTREQVKRIIEALLFAVNKPLSLRDIRDIIEEGAESFIKEIIEELKSEYTQSKRSFNIVEIAGGYQVVTDTYYAPWIKKLFKEDRPKTLSMPALETLAIIAYRQPITKSEIESIRGVNVEGVIQTLLEKNLIKPSGRKEAPGRPFFYVTTEEFLVHFGLRSLQDLPKLKEFEEEDVKLGTEHAVVENVDNMHKQEQEEKSTEKMKGGGVQDDSQQALSRKREDYPTDKPDKELIDERPEVASERD